MDRDVYFSRFQPKLDVLFALLTLAYFAVNLPAFRPKSFWRLAMLAPVAAIYSSGVSRTSVLPYYAYLAADICEVMAVVCITVIQYPALITVCFHANKLLSFGHLLVVAPSAGTAGMLVFHLFELYRALATQQLRRQCGALLRPFEYIPIAADCKSRLKDQEDALAELDSLAAKYALPTDNFDIQFDITKRVFVFRAILTRYWRPLVRIALGEALLGAADVWKVVSLGNMFALSSDYAQATEIMLTLVVRYVLCVFLSGFRLYHYGIKNKLTEQVENMLCRELCKAFIMAPGSVDEHETFDQEKSNVIPSYVTGLMQIVNCFSPISGLVGNTAILYSLFGWRTVFIALVVIVLTLISEWVYGQYVKRKKAENPQALHSRLTQLMPAVSTFKMLAIEDIVFRLKASDFINTRASALDVLSKSITQVASGTSAYLAAMGLIGTHYALAAPFEIVSTVSLLQQTATLCAELVKNIGGLHRLATAERAIGARLAANIHLPAHNGARGPAAATPRINMTDASFKRRAGTAIALQVNRLAIKAGQLVAVTGAVGMGKSTLLLAMLRELDIVSGSSSVDGSIAYVGQPPWIMGSTVRENILFGRPYNKRLYGQAISLSCLREDLAQMTGGDLTVISDHGTTLSGGQRARLALARALYAQADIYLLDGTLSELDAVVQSTIWNNVVSNTGALRNTIRIVVTDDRKYVEQCNVEIIVADGRVKATKEWSTDAGTGAVVQDFNRGRIDSMDSSNAEQDCDAAAESLPRPKQPPRIIIPTTSTKLQAGWFYIRVCGAWSLAAAVAIALATFAVPTALYQRQTALLHHTAADSASRDTMLETYAKYSVAMAGTNMLLSWVKYVAEEWLYVLFNRPKVVGALLSSLAHARMSEFWQIGEYRLLSTVRMSERVMLYGVHKFAFESVSKGAAIMYSMYSSYWISLTALPVLICACTALFYANQHDRDVLVTIQRYRNSIGQGQGKLVSDLFSGAQTVRAFQVYDYFDARIARLDATVANIGRLSGAVINSKMFFQFAIEQLLVMSLTGVWMLKIGQGALGDAADVQIYYQMLTESVPLLNYMLSIQLEIKNAGLALQEFCDNANLETEGPRHVPDQVPDAWPRGGGIEFADCKMRYNRNEEPALNGVSVCIRPGENIGIVGRTGSGKSSLISALLRIVELEAGAILIDGVDISQIGVHDLRQQVSVVPQAAALFEGTLRENLDPFGEYSEAEVDGAIRDAGLEGLGADWWIESGGRNLSGGQQQLAGICRAILQRRRIVVLDEATASIDGESARAIRAVVAAKFRHSTVLTIAHRLETVQDCDQILVMRGGRVAEFGTPAALLAAQGLFAELVAADRGRGDARGPTN